MKKDKLILNCLLILGLSFTLVFPVLAQEQQRKRFVNKQNKEELFQKIVEELNLTSQQQEKIKEIQALNQEKRKQIREELNQERKKLKGILADGNSNRQAAQEIADKIKKLMGELIDLRIEMVFSLKEILTPEQFKQMHQNKEEFRPKHKLGASSDVSGPDAMDE